MVNQELTGATQLTQKLREKTALRITINRQREHNHVTGKYF